jgi:hypothetical protein
MEAHTMSIRPKFRTLALLLAAPAMLAFSVPAYAQAQQIVLSAEPGDPNPGNLTITGAIDFTNNYMFRGIRQDADPQLIMQPYFDLGIALHSADSGLKSATINFGTWNSLHTGGSGLDSASGKLWYESDFYAALGFGFKAGTFNMQYTAYTSPNTGFTTVKEIFLKFTGDDSAALGKAAMHPYGLVAFEMGTEPGTGQADAGQNAGTYLELGVAPGYAGSKATLAFPIKVGLSLSDYYELNEGTALLPNYVDHMFGYFSVAGAVTVPITKATSPFGTWNVHGSVEFQQLGDTTKVINADENGDPNSHKVIATVGLGFTY